ncbi:hypothetical protein AL515_22995 [Citrobacter sp. FDAARGOS_156]|uniref:Uncharacterized protein n=1 Tax=Citrobacter pasteurii TaxID=1563222 RepID=A0A6N6K144_9ENTR|nr:hypothetical protein AL515_22995 [Citrobacter sp. FDAARGOS_156]KAA1276986.1 hypothetical protein DXF85_15770 [Citrobacter pasteurii]
MPLFSAIHWSIPIPQTGYPLIADRGRDPGRRGVGCDRSVKNHIFFTEVMYSFRVMINFRR